MLVFPNCKINMGLHITSRRPDGFHNIESVFLPVPWVDMLEIIPSEENSFIMDGIPVDCSVQNNLCYKAYQLLKADFNLPPVALYLYKKIPSGAGLGGGSSDAAFTLKVLNDIFKLNLTGEVLSTYAALLGSDCSFFIANTAAVATGKGEVLQPIELTLKGYHLAIIKPPISVSTADAYALIQPKTPKNTIMEILLRDISEWRHHLKNDFEEVVFARYPALQNIKNMLYTQGAIYAAMSGSGSAIYGIFANKVDIALLFQDCLVWQGSL